MRAFLALPLVLVVSLATGCGTSDDGLFSPGSAQDAGPGGELDASMDGEVNGDGEGGTSDAGGCLTAADCDDGIACTVDSCALGVCRHVTDSSLCPSGQVCEAGKGCAPGLPCSSDAQCEASLGHDPCRVKIHCDQASATCRFSNLDNDGDGHPPIVCGGGDCDDSDPDVYPGATETCNGKDDDCNGNKDDFAVCPDGNVCQAGQCACPPKNVCNGVCVDFETDRMNCGACGIRCGGGEACESGLCKRDTSCKAPALFLMQDISGSMDADNRWASAKAGIQAFVNEAASSGLGVGLGYFPVAATGSVPSSCTIDADCGIYGPCFFGMCAGSIGGAADSCEIVDYETPAVPIAKLPGNAAAITSSLGAKTPVGGSPLAVPLAGALRYAKTWANANSDSRPAVVIVSDNVPNICQPKDGLEEAVAAAEAGLSGTPSIKTFVIRWEGADGTDAQWRQLAQAGGGATNFYPVGSASQMQAALGAIRTAISGCP